MLSRPVQRALVLVTAVTLLGTAWSTVAKTYLDTSNPLVANLPHPLHASSYFANKRNIFNTLFVKRAWAWTSAAIVLNLYSNPRRAPARIWRFALATACWAAFTMWFFGPSVRARLASLSGAECIVTLPHTTSDGVHVLTVPAEYCIQRRTLSTREHAEVFQQALLGNTGAPSIPDDWRGVPKLTRGHDISGHVFLLSLSILTLVDDLFTAAPPSGAAGFADTQLATAALSSALCALWYWMLLMTSVYFHAPFEKITGLIVGISAYLVTKIPFPFEGAPPVISAQPVPVVPIEKKTQ
ncbi:hypothetical protein EXIGLDRAFT_643311 [Exidia glandulosa HHB12029]|uniref:Inositol phospholipid biosynthesis protein Scs3 n=1 Tax=Exidia glandulosa HHB12029 TaxID=1314781 RepID=A0A165KF63_EXIGL|nr:hypothetical protein EXIGLDRAFT_643311 [Exidia glandulosa HHB12029]